MFRSRGRCSGRIRRWAAGSERQSEPDAQARVWRGFALTVPGARYWPPILRSEHKPLLARRARIGRRYSATLCPEGAFERSPARSAGAMPPRARLSPVGTIEASIAPPGLVSSVAHESQHFVLGYDHIVPTGRTVTGVMHPDAPQPDTPPQLPNASFSDGHSSAGGMQRRSPI